MCGSPAQFVLLGLVPQMFDQCGHSVRQFALPVRPCVGTQGFVPKHTNTNKGLLKISTILIISVRLLYKILEFFMFLLIKKEKQVITSAERSHNAVCKQSRLS